MQNTNLSDKELKKYGKEFKKSLKARKAELDNFVPCINDVIDYRCILTIAYYFFFPRKF